MKQETINSLGFAILFNVFESVEEYNEAYATNGGAPSENACLDSANRNVTYRSTMAQARKLLCLAVEEETGFERATKEVGQKKDGTPKVEYAQNESGYIEAAIEGEHITRERVGEIFQEIATGLQPDPSGRKPAEPKLRKPQKKFLTAAQNFIDANRAEEVAEKLSAELGEEIKPELDSIARGIQLKIQKAEEAQLAAF